MGKIEVGDVFTFDEGNTEYVCDRIGDSGLVHADGFRLPRVKCHLVRKANPLPEIPKTWQFRHEPWVPPVPKTLADVPDDVDVIAANSRFSDGELYVMRNKGGMACYATIDGENRSNEPPSVFTFVRYLDQPPAKPLSLDDVPAGRVIARPECDWLYWRHGGNWISYSRSGGWIRSAFHAAEFTEFQVTDLVAELK